MVGGAGTRCPQCCSVRQHGHACAACQQPSEQGYVGMSLQSTACPALPPAGPHLPQGHFAVFLTSGGALLPLATAPPPPPPPLPSAAATAAREGKSSAARCARCVPRWRSQPTGGAPAARPPPPRKPPPRSAAGRAAAAAAAAGNSASSMIRRPPSLSCAYPYSLGQSPRAACCCSSPPLPPAPACTDRGAVGCSWRSEDHRWTTKSQVWDI